MGDPQMSDDRYDEIAARHGSDYNASGDDDWLTISGDVAWLLGEVGRLRRAIAKRDQLLEATINDRERLLAENERLIATVQEAIAATDCRTLVDSWDAISDLSEPIRLLGELEGKP